MKDWPILTTIILLPVVGAFFLAILRGNDEAADRNARWIALWTTLVTFAVSLVLLVQFDPTNSGFQFVEHHPWLSNKITYYVGVDGLSLPFVILTTFLLPISILASWTSITERVKEYMIAFLLLETLMVGVFVSLDLVLFYLFFEGGLIPMFLIIGVWGGPRRVYASFKFFLYTLLGSLLMLLAILAMYGQAGTTEIPTLLKFHFPENLQTWLWFAFLASFAVKLPMWPVHTWLPDAHVEAPTAGSVILAAILLKMGGYGFLRFSLPMFPEASVTYAPLMFTLGVAAILYTSLVAFAQKDMKKLIAYSSVAHMGFVTLGVFSGTFQGAQGRGLPDDQPRHRFGRALPFGRRRLRPHAHARNRGLWRARRPDADLCFRFHGLHHGECRAAGHKRFCRRVPVASRHIPRQQHYRAFRDLRDHPLGLVCADPLPAHHFREAGEAIARQDHRHEPARDRDHGAACHFDDRARLLPEAGIRHDLRRRESDDSPL